jgi:hypothetical protein
LSLFRNRVKTKNQEGFSMNIRNRSWKWLLALGLIMALFLVTGSTEVRAGNTYINITEITSPTGRPDLGWVEGTTNVTGTPTFTVQFLDAEGPASPLPGTVVETVWITPTHWKLTVTEPANMPGGHYNVKVIATYPNNVTLTDTSTPGQGTPDCSNTWCNCPC